MIVPDDFDLNQLPQEERTNNPIKNLIEALKHIKQPEKEARTQVDSPSVDSPLET